MFLKVPLNNKTSSFLMIINQNIQWQSDYCNGEGKGWLNSVLT